jgi:type I restriction enzyme S subunit
MSWKKVKLGDFLKVRDNRFKPNDKAISDLKRIDKIDFSGEIFISDKPSNTDMILIKKGDLVISGINVEKGAMAVYTGEEDITATIHYSSYCFDENRTDIEFLKSFLKSIEFKNALKEQVPGGIKTEIKPKHILPLVVMIPTDIKDQREVVKLLHNRNSKVDAISTELTNQLSLVKKLRQQLLQDAVQGKLVEQNKKDEPAIELLKKIKTEKEKLMAEKKLKKEKELPSIKPEEIPFDIPENWVWCRLGDSVILKRGKSKHRPRNDASLFEGGTHPFIQTGDVARSKTNGYLIETINGYYNDFGLSQSLMQKKGTLCITIAANIAECGFLGFDACAPDSIVCLNAIDQIIEKYCFYYIIQAREDIEKYAPATAQKNINLEILNSLLIPLPPFAEQNRIVQKLDELMQYCNELEASIKQSESQNEKLLQLVLREALRKEPVEA